MFNIEAVAGYVAGDQDNQTRDVMDGIDKVKDVRARDLRIKIGLTIYELIHDLTILVMTIIFMIKMHFAH